MCIVYLLIIQEFKKDVIETQIKVFRRKFLAYHLCKLKIKLIAKIKHRKVEIIEYERKVIKNNWYIRYK